MIKKFVSIILFIVLVFSFSACGAKGQQSTTTTTQENTTIEETTKKILSKEEAIEVAKDELDDILCDEFVDEGVFAHIYDIEYAPYFITAYDESKEQWEIEIIGQCSAKEYESGRYLGRYTFEADIYVTNNGIVSGSTVQGPFKI